MGWFLLDGDESAANPAFIGWVLMTTVNAGDTDGLIKLNGTKAMSACRNRLPQRGEFRLHLLEPHLAGVAPADVAHNGWRKHGGDFVLILTQRKPASVVVSKIPTQILGGRWRDRAGGVTHSAFGHKYPRITQAVTAKVNTSITIMATSQG